jgi:hypothetical protein
MSPERKRSGAVLSLEAGCGSFSAMLRPRPKLRLDRPPCSAVRVRVVGADRFKVVSTQPRKVARGKASQSSPSGTSSRPVSAGVSLSLAQRRGRVGQRKSKRRPSRRFDAAAHVSTRGRLLFPNTVRGHSAASKFAAPGEDTAQRSRARVWLGWRLRPRRAVAADVEASPSDVAGSSTRCDRFPVRREDI